jgi:aspartate-semialdehyde dehydrogenase
MGYRVGVVGATGAVGTEMVKILESRNFPVDDLRLFASQRSAGKTVVFKDTPITVQELTEDFFKQIDLALFSAGASVSRVFAPLAAKKDKIIIDNSSAFRMNKEIPLVVPEVNPHAVKDHKGIISNPNCSTIQMVVVLKPLYNRSRIKRLVISTYQAVSGTGKKAMWELEQQIEAWVKNQPFPQQVYPHQIAFNILPEIGKFLDNLYTEEEMKMINETRKILEDDDIRITATTVRVPVFVGHAEAVNIEFEEKITVQEAREILSQSPGIVVVDNPKESEYPLPIRAAGRDEVFVGRIREDESCQAGLNVWIVADNLRKGAALNAVQIGELLLEKGLL